MNCEYAMVGACEVRGPKLLNTDINTTAMITHKIRFLAKSFKT